MSHLNVIVPYTRLHPVVRAVLESYAVGAQFVHVPNPDSYWRLLARLWDAAETFAIVEQDIAVWPGALEEIFACRMAWCSYTYYRHIAPDRVSIGDYHGFGCVKFEGALMAEHPRLWADMADHHWSRLDSQFEEYAHAHHLRPHCHRPAVIHLREGVCL